MSVRQGPFSWLSVQPPVPPVPPVPETTSQVFAEPPLCKQVRPVSHVWPAQQGSVTVPQGWHVPLVEQTRPVQQTAPPLPHATPEALQAPPVLLPVLVPFTPPVLPPVVVPALPWPPLVLPALAVAVPPSWPEPLEQATMALAKNAATATVKRCWQDAFIE